MAKRNYQLSDEGYGDPFDILGVETTSTDQEAREAFRQLSKQCHPDLFPGDAAKEAEFKALTWAKDVLDDEDQRLFWSLIRSSGGKMEPTGDEEVDEGNLLAARTYGDCLEGIAQNCVMVHRDITEFEPLEVAIEMIRQKQEDVQSSLSLDRKLLKKLVANVGKTVKKDVRDKKKAKLNPLEGILQGCIVGTKDSIASRERRLRVMNHAMTFLYGFEQVEDGAPSGAAKFLGRGPAPVRGA